MVQIDFDYFISIVCIIYCKFWDKVWIRQQKNESKAFDFIDMLSWGQFFSFTKQIPSQRVPQSGCVHVNREPRPGPVSNQSGE